MEASFENNKSFYAERDIYFKAGLGLIAFCLFLYILAAISSPNSDGNVIIIFINYLSSIIYLIITIGVKRSYKTTNTYHYICLMTLATISCLTLNLEINVFDTFSTWVNFYLFLMYGGLVAFCFLDKISNRLRPTVFFSLGMGTIMAAYFTLYLLPLMPFGIVLCFFFGITLHLIVPLFVLINNISLFVKVEKSNTEKTAYALGLGTPILVAFLFTMQWGKTNQLIQKTYKNHQSINHNGLPAWVSLSQQLSDGFFTQRILKGEILYTTLHGDNWNSWGRINNSFQDKKEHDPLIAIASFFSGPLKISKKDRLQILKFYSNNRHDTQRKLWSGKHLTTSKISNKILIYPEYRLAYTEKTFTIKNTSQNSWRQEEALYTFSLPEGSVASSLSLWVNGVEQNARLTTKSKADNAYVNIVGVERRDPALLHWQEGNQLTVTVFPCTAKEDRIFKIGITSPLSIEEEQLVLSPVDFEGPYATLAKEHTLIEFPTQKKYTYETDFSGRILCDKIPLSKSSFNFEDKRFEVEEYQIQNQHFDPQYVYLDVNKSWTKREFHQILKMYPNTPVFMLDNNKIVSISTQNLSIFEEAQQHNFSLFPIHKITDPKHSLLISKSPPKSPNLSDLKETFFGKSVVNYLEQETASIAFYNLSPTLSPYLQSLKEFYVFNYTQGSLDKLAQWSKRKQFVKQISDPNKIVLHTSNTLLLQTENKSTTTSTAPDHLMRLFSYNQILKKIGKGYFLSGYENQDLVDIASTAHIVSPISSMIVLETQKDYERFDIEENEEGLGNASDSKKGLKNAIKNSSGAVPEPHEWCFIVLISLGLLFLQIKKHSF